jgi:hypothetical protein
MKVQARFFQVFRLVLARAVGVGWAMGKGCAYGGQVI